MSRRVEVRLNEKDAAYIKEQATQQKITQTDFLRAAIWRDASVAEIRDQTWTS